MENQEKDSTYHTLPWGCLECIPPPWQKKAEKNIVFGAKFEKLRVGRRTELSEGQRGAKLSEGGGRGARFLRDTMFFCKHVISVAILFNSYH